MNRLFGTKKKAPPEVKAPSLQETSGKVLQCTTHSIDGRTSESNRSKGERLHQAAEWRKNADEEADRRGIQEQSEEGSYYSKTKENVREPAQ